MRRTGSLHVAGLVVGVGLALAACGIGTDDAPRDIVPQAPKAEVDQGRTAITATATTLIYLVGHDDDGRFVLMPIARDTTETIDNALQSLFNGPTARELNADLRSAIPPSVRLNKAAPNNDVVTIDVSEELTQLSGSTLVDAVGQIVLTATNVTGITGVVITVDDAVHPWPTPDGTTSVDPLERGDYEMLLPKSAVTDPTVDPAATTIVATSLPETPTPIIAPAAPTAPGTSSP